MVLELKTNSLRLMMLLVLHAITSLKPLQVAEALIAWCYVAAALVLPVAEAENLCSCCRAMLLPQSCRLNAEAEVQSRCMALVAELRPRCMLLLKCALLLNASAEKYTNRCTAE